MVDTEAEVAARADFSGFAIAYQDYGQGKIRLTVVSVIGLAILVLAAGRALPLSAYPCTSY